ncbi:MAG: DUF6353 family protein [Clostridia bacterium]
MNITKNIKKIRFQLEKYSPEILTGIGIAGMVSTTIMAVKATPKALMLIEEKKLDDGVEDISKRDIIKLTGRCYIPSVIVGVGSIGCLISGNSVNAKRHTVIATAYSLSETILKEYQEKVIETIGDEKERVIREDIQREKIQNTPVNSKEVIVTYSGDTMCFDVLSGRYFKSNIDSIKQTINILNKNMLDEMYISLNEFYYEIGLPNISLGDELGWNISNGLIEPEFSTQLTENGEPCIVLGYIVSPKYDFSTNY